MVSMVGKSRWLSDRESLAHCGAVNSSPPGRRSRCPRESLGPGPPDPSLILPLTPGTEKAGVELYRCGSLGVRDRLGGSVVDGEGSGTWARHFLGWH